MKKIQLLKTSGMALTAMLVIAAALTNYLHLSSTQQQARALVQHSFSSRKGSSDMGSIIASLRMLSTNETFSQITMKHEEEVLYNYTSTAKQWMPGSTFSVWSQDASTQITITSVIPTTQLVILITIFATSIISAFVMRTIAINEGIESQKIILRYLKQYAHDIQAPIRRLQAQSRDASILHIQEIDLISSLSKKLLADNMKIRNESYCLIQVCKNVLDHFQRSCPTNIQLSLTVLQPAVVTNFGDPTNVQRSILNFLQNSSEAIGTSDPGSIEVIVCPLTKKIRIIDSGPGFPQQVIDSRGRNNFTSKQDGYGIGIAGSIEMLESESITTRISNSNGGVVMLSFDHLKSSLLYPSSRYALIDDDKYVRNEWKKAAETYRISLTLYESWENFKSCGLSYHFIFIDRYLPEGDGQLLASQLSSNVILTTSCFYEDYRDFKIEGVCGKSPPFVMKVKYLG